MQGEFWHLTQKVQMNKTRMHVMLLNCLLNRTADTKQSDMLISNNTDRTNRIDDFVIELYNFLWNSLLDL
jgi:hypothetical protein